MVLILHTKVYSQLLQIHYWMIIKCTVLLWYIKVSCKYLCKMHIYIWHWLHASSQGLWCRKYIVVNAVPKYWIKTYYSPIPKFAFLWLSLIVLASQCSWCSTHNAVKISFWNCEISFVVSSSQLLVYFHSFIDILKRIKNSK